MYKMVRISPDFRAKEFSVGTIKTGNNGKQWIIKVASNGVKRWSPVDVKQKSPVVGVKQKPYYEMYGMFTVAGAKKIDALVKHIKKRRPLYTWNEIMNQLDKISNNPKFSEAMDTAVRENVHVSVENFVADD